jgi:hypothetical protein
VSVDPRIIPPVSLSEDSQQTRTENPPDVKPAPPVNSNLAVWLLRIRALLLVTVCATFGVLLIILPWTPKWTDNVLLMSWPDLRPIVSNGFVRGLCSGLGVLDLWLGFWEAINYHERPIGGH